MGALAGLEQLELRAAGDDFLAEADERLDEVAQRQRFRAAAAQRQHVGREARLGGGVAPQLVEHDVGGGVALQVDDDADAFAVRFVADVGDALDALVLGGLGDLLDQPGLADLERDFGEDDRAAVAAAFLDRVARTLEDRSAAGCVGGADSGGAEDLGAGREVRPLHMLHQAFGRDRRIVHEGPAGIDDFTEIMRRDVGCHADRDAAGAIDEDVGKARREHLGLTLGRVVIGLEVDGVLVEVAEQEVGDLGKSRLGVAHRCRRIGVDRAEIALAVDQRHPHRPILGHACQGVVDRLVAVRVILTHHLTDQAGRFAIGAPGDESGFLRRVEDPAVDGLQAVANIGQRAADDDAHRIVEVAGLHLLDDGDGSDRAVVGLAGMIGRWLGGQEAVLSVRLHGHRGGARLDQRRSPTWTGLAQCEARRHPARACVRARGSCGRPVTCPTSSIRPNRSRRWHWRRSAPKRKRTNIRRR